MKNYLFFSLLAVVVFYTLTNNSNNAANNNGWSSCSGCHGASANTIVDSLYLLHPVTNAVMTGYYPDSTYKIRMKAFNTTGVGSFPNFGFQIRAVNASLANVGSFPSPPGGTGVQAAGFLTQSSALAHTGGFYIVEASWKAPAAAFGTLTLQSGVNAVNNNGGTGGDAFSSVIKITTFPVLGTVATLDCGTGSTSGSLQATIPSAGVSFTVPYTGGNGGAFPAYSVTSTGVTGLTAAISAASFANGGGTLVFNVSGTPNAAGTASFLINMGTRTCTYNITVVGAPGSISTLDCQTSIIAGTLNAGSPAAGVSISVPYTGGNGGIHSGQVIASTGVTGLTATLAAGSFMNGSGNLTYTISGTPTSAGAASFALNIGGQNCLDTIMVNAPLATISTINCSSGTLSGSLYDGVTASNVTYTISYTGGNAGTYPALNATSTGVAGLTASRTAGSVAFGNGTLTYTITGTPTSVGTAAFSVPLAGFACSISMPVNIPNGTIDSFQCAGGRAIGTLLAAVPASSVSYKLPYVNGNGGAYANASFTSTGVTGLTATVISDTFKIGNDSLTILISGTPASVGNANFTLTIAGKSCNISLPVILPNGSLTSINCASGVLSSPVVLGVNTVGTLFKIYGSGGNGGFHGGQTVSSAGVTGLTATLAADTFNHGNDTLIYQLTGIATSPGNATFAINIGGQNCVFTIPITIPVGTVTGFNCANATQFNTVQYLSTPTNVTLRVPYTGGNGGSYAAQSVASSGILGLTASLVADRFKIGDSFVTYTITGIPSNYGIANFNLSLGGRSCSYALKVLPHVGTITNLECNVGTLSAQILSGTSANGKTYSLPYVGGNRGYYTARVLTSSGVTGITATLDSGVFANGDGALVFALSGTPNGIGNANFNINIGGKNCTFAVVISPPPANVATVNCMTASVSQPLRKGINVSGTTLLLPYTGGNGGTNQGQSVISTGVSGVTATSSSIALANGGGNAIYNLTGIPTSVGNLSFNLTVGGKSCLFSTQVDFAPADVTALNCVAGVLTGSLKQGDAASGVSFTVPYTGGNEGPYPAISANSAGVIGLTATSPAGSLVLGNGEINFDVAGTPVSGGETRFTIRIGSKSCLYKIPVEALPSSIRQATLASHIFYHSKSIQIEALKTKGGYQIMDVAGKIILKGEVQAGNSKIDLNTLAAAVYSFILTSENSTQQLRFNME